MIKLHKIENNTSKLIIICDWHEVDYITNIRDYYENILPLLIVAKKFYSMRKILEYNTRTSISYNTKTCLDEFLRRLAIDEKEHMLFDQFSNKLDELLFTLLPVETESFNRIHTIKHMYIFKDGDLYEPDFDNDIDVRNSIHWLMHNDIMNLLYT